MAPMTATTMDQGSGVRVGNAASGWAPPPGGGRWQLADGEAMVAALRASGEKPAVFARRHGLHEARVQRWVARVERKSRSPRAVAFAPVRVTTERATASGLEVAIGGAVVRVSRGFDDELLRRVIAALGEASC